MGLNEYTVGLSWVVDSRTFSICGRKALGVGGNVLFMQALGLCCGEDVMEVLRGEGIGFFPDDVRNEVCTFSAALGRVGFDADGEAGRLGLKAE